jgi:hypothetical protein
MFDQHRNPKLQVSIEQKIKKARVEKQLEEIAP